MSELEDYKTGRELFPFGKMLEVHEIGEYALLEYLEFDFSQDRPLTNKHAFAVFINGYRVSLHAYTLDSALLMALALKYDGRNSQAARLMGRMIGVDGPIDDDAKPYYEP